MHAALAASKRVMLDQVGLFADGVAVRQAGTETFRLCRDLLDEIITVDADAICAAVKDIFDDTRAIAEPLGAVGLAGLKKYVEREGACAKALITVNSGAKNNFRPPAPYRGAGRDRRVPRGAAGRDDPGEPGKQPPFYP